ncbi:MAG: hypothetical protein IJ952_07565, partial [Alistipes sp.]|nr:hypothetical protein [Alistipes sp.]
VAFPEAHDAKIMQAAYECATEGYIQAILVGDAAQLKALAAERYKPCGGPPSWADACRYSQPIIRGTHT